MLPYSEKEYENLRRDTAELRNCITKYVGFILAVAGISGSAKYIHWGSADVVSQMFLLSVSLVVITLLFEIVWYKIKSHNRYNGYMELLMQEQDVILMKDLSEDNVENKEYISKYKDFIASHNRLPKNLLSWEQVMSRINNNFFQVHGSDVDEKRQDLIASTETCRFVFSVSERTYQSIEVRGRDTEFFEKIIWKLYGDKARRYWLKVLKEFISSLGYLLNINWKCLIDDYGVDKRYLVSGWKYPKKIAQIGFAVACTLFIYILYIYVTSYRFDGIENIPVVIWGNKSYSVLMLVSFSAITRWIFTYVRNLNELIYGKHSIESYCWNFFVFRVQMLNSKGMIPIYFSRSFLRYYKSKCILEYVRTQSCKKNISQEEFIAEMSNLNYRSECESKLIKDYKNKLENYKEFSKKERSDIHKPLVSSFKDQLL